MRMSTLSAPSELVDDWPESPLRPGMGWRHRRNIRCTCRRQNSGRLRSAASRRITLRQDPESDVVVHWDRVSATTPATRLALSVVECLRQVVLHEAEDDAVACVDSALRNGQLDLIDFELLRQSLPARCRKIMDVTNGGSDSYPESIIRRRLARAGIRTQIQVKVLDERWIDLLIGDRLALEIDGRGKYLKDPRPSAIVHRFEEEKHRDAFLFALGYIVIHVTYEMLMDDWEATLSMILAVMARGDHLHRPERRQLKRARGVPLETRRAEPAMS